MVDTFHGEAEGCFLYSRHGTLATIPGRRFSCHEGTELGWVTGSGMGAITVAILGICQSGDHIISSMTTYGGTFAFMKNWLPRYNIEVTFLDITDLDAVKKAMRPNTKRFIQRR